MEHVFSYMTLAFGGMLMLYAGLLRLTLDVRMIPKHWAVEMKDPRNYAKMVAHIVIFLALAFLAGGWVGVYARPLFGFLTLAVCLVLAIWLSVRLWRSPNNKNR